MGNFKRKKYRPPKDINWGSPKIYQKNYEIRKVKEDTQVHEREGGRLL